MELKFNLLDAIEFEKMLDEYAKLIVTVGLNLQKGQKMVLSAPITGASFARRLTRTAYASGARDVEVVWTDEKLARLKYDLASPDVFDTFPAWKQKLYLDYTEEGAAFCTLLSSNPDIFSDVEPDLIQRNQISAGNALKKYRTNIMSNKNRWCIAAISSPSWAKRVFSDLFEEEATEKLWNAIFSSVRVKGEDNAIDKWHKHLDFLAKASEYLNSKRFSALHYRNSLGTDLVVELPKDHIWVGGSEEAADGVQFVANLPTEEVYTLPARNGVNGIVYSTKPLLYHGSRIEDFYLKFENGRVVDFQAEQGQELLESLLETDEGARHLGEVALVPYNSPISKSNVLFYNTLFDENASSHFALGKAYPTCLKDGEKKTTDELLSLGVNDSLVHEDFMVGTKDLSIMGILPSGDQSPIFVDGNFVEFK